MKIVQIKISNFRGIRSCELLLPEHAVLIGDNNVGKSTVLEAIDLCLGPDRLSRQPPVDEHDFHLGKYLSSNPAAPVAAGLAEPAVEAGATVPEGGEQAANPMIEVEVTISNLSVEQQDHFGEQIEWWDIGTNALYIGDAAGLDDAKALPAIRVTFQGFYNEDEDDFAGNSVFTRSIDEDEKPTPFSKRDKQKCGFLYLRTLRTGSRALSLERGSLLDIILRLKEIRPRMWEDTIGALKTLDVAGDPELGVSGILESVNKALKKYVPREWGANPHLRVSTLTREHLRKVITAFIATGDGTHAAPFYRQGAGTINMLVLALLSQIAEDKQNVIFAMEEVETAIPPYAQKRIVHELRKLSAQSLLTSHSPYVLEEFDIDETLILSRTPDGILSKATVQLPDSVKLKRYRQEFRQRFCEGLLAGRVLIVEGATEASSYPAVARRLAELDGTKYASLEALGICVIDAGTDSQVAVMAKLYRDLGKRTFGACDKQKDADKDAIEAQVEKLFMHDEHGFEDLVLKETTQAALVRFAGMIEWPPHLLQQFGDPKADAANALPALFKWAKGGWSLADFLVQCTEEEIPKFLKDACITLKQLCAPEETEAEAPPEEGAADAA
ncbi:ATP-dependent nuclease [Rhizobium leguminosarum]|uniref:ATP-dependent nuclease n=1 Tax=Rhizobium leguminosarum TaxID=384 RepID=UPI001AE6E58E|nr:AAA family ATPase [Rhizobium leguminosarum]MBP2450071.1 putative ATP-dependent endonuclease of OLD family [Rhizobium leguminosarum]